MELLRYDSPAQAMFRRATAECDVGGFHLRPRDNIVLLPGAANRDSEALDDPDRLDVARPGRAHVSLGRGIRHCLGAQLARLEWRIAFEMLLGRFPRMGLLVEHPRFRPSMVLRGLESLPLRCADLNSRAEPAGERAGSHDIAGPAVTSAAVHAASARARTPRRRSPPRAACPRS